MSTQELPHRWSERLIQKGFVDPRYRDRDVPSMSALAAATGVHTSTLANALFGRGKQPSASTVVALTTALGDDVAEWLGRGRPTAWTPPDAVALLTDRQIKAIEELIRAMTEQRGSGHGDSTPTSPAGEPPAPTDLSTARVAREATVTPEKRRTAARKSTTGRKPD